MQKRIMFGNGMRCMIVLILAVVICACMLVTSVGAYLDGHPLYAANSFITKSMTGAVVNGDNSVTYPVHKHTDTAKDGASQRSYLPTQYLELPEYGTYDLSKVLQKSVNQVDASQDNQPVQYNTDPAHRIVGIERRGNMKLIDNSRYADAGFNFASWGEDIQGPGVYYHNVSGATQMRSGLLYITLAIPDAKTEYAHALKIGLDSTIYGQSNNRVDSAFAVFADPVGSPDAQVAMWDGVVKDKGGLGFAFGKADWVIPGDMPHMATINPAITYGAQRIGDGSLFSDIADGGDFRYQHHPLDTETYDVPAGTKYIRIMIMSEVGVGADLAITNFKVDLKGFGPAPYTLESMGADITGPVTYNENNRRNGSVPYTARESADGRISYFPTSYLLPTLGTEVDMSVMLGDVIGKGASCYPNGKANRLIGVERRGEYTVHTAEAMNGSLGLTSWSPESAYGDPIGSAKFGTGLSIHGQSASGGSMAFYFTVAMPDHLVAGDGEYTLNWSFNTRSFGEDMDGACHRLSAGYAVYADTAPNTGVAAPIQRADGRVSDESNGFDHSVPWSVQANGDMGFNLREDRANGLVAVPGANGTIYSQNLHNDYLDKAVRISVPVPKDTRFLRCVVAFDSDDIASPSKIKQAITNMHISISDSGKPSVSLEAVDPMASLGVSQMVMLRANSAGKGLPLSEIADSIVIHAIDPYTGGEWSSSYATLPTNGDGHNIVWKTDIYEDVTKTATNVAGDTLTKTYKDTGCNTRLHTKASRIWVTYGGSSADTYKDGHVPGVDKGAPSIVEQNIAKKDVHLTSITLILDEQSDIVSATISGQDMTDKPMTIDNTAKSVSSQVTKAGNYVIKVTDTYGYTLETTVEGVQCYIGATPRLGVGVEIVSADDGYIDAGESVAFRFTSTSYGKRLKAPLSVTKVVERYNYGMVAEYVITYTDSVDESILANIEAIDVHITIDNGAPDTVAFGTAKTYTYTPREQDLGKVFVGWYDAKGILVTTNETITIRPTRDVVLRSKCVPASDVMIRFENMSGKTLDVQGYTLVEGQTIEELVAGFDAKTVTHLPVSPFETFVGWQIQDKTNMSDIVVRTVYSTAKTFNVTIDSSTYSVMANDKVSLRKYAKDTTKGWKMNGEVVSTTPDYECYAMADMTFESIEQIAEGTDTVLTSTTTAGNMPVVGAVTVISGQLNNAKKYSEVGFVFVDGNIEDKYLRVDSKYGMQVPTYSIKGGQNMIIIEDSAFKNTQYGNAKYRLYAIDASTGVAEYSRVYTL